MREKSQIRTVQSIIESRLSNRTAHIERMRRYLLRQRARVTLDVMVALYVGRIDISTQPESAIADKLATELYHRFMKEVIEQAVSDFLTLGLGGVSITRYGVGLFSPENAVCYPDERSPEWTARKIFLSLRDAIDRFGLEFFEDDLNKHIEEYGDDPIGFSISDPIVLYEVITDSQILYYRDDELMITIPRLPWEGHFYIKGYHRYDIPEMGERSTTECDLPISLFEYLLGIRFNEVPLFEAHSKLLDAIAKLSLRTSVILVRQKDVHRDSNSFKEFQKLFDPIFFEGDDSPIFFLDRVSLPELQTALREIEMQITSLTGVTPYMLSQVGLTETATEALTMQQMSNIRTSFWQLEIYAWLDRVLESFRAMLVRMPVSKQVPILFYEMNPETGQIEEYLFGTPETPYSVGLDGIKLGLANMGLNEEITKRQNIQQVLSFVVSLYQLLAAQNTHYDIGKLVDRLMLAFGFDPTDYKIVQMGQPVEQPEQAIPPNGSPMPEDQSVVRGTPNPTFSQINSIRGIINKLSGTTPPEEVSQEQHLRDILSGLEEQLGGN